MVSLVVPNKYQLFFQKPERVEVLIQQLEKDLPELENTLSANINSIFESLLTYFANIEDNSALPQVLYRIDVSEKSLHQKMSLGKYQSFSRVLAESVLIREMEKVFYRITYS